MNTFKLAFRNVFRNGRRSMLSGVAIAVSACAIVFMYALNDGMMDDLSWNIRSYQTGNVRIRNAEFGKHERINPINLNISGSESLVAELRARPETEAVSARISFPSQIYIKRDHFNAMGMGVDFATETDFIDLKPVVEKKTARGYTGRLPEAGKNEALVGAGLARKMGIGIDSKITVLTQTATRGSNGMTFTVTGLVTFQYASMSESLFLIPLDRAQYFLRMPDSSLEILVKTVPGTDNALFAESLKSTLDARGRKDLEILPWEKIDTSLGMMEMADISYLILSLFFMVLGSTVIINTTMMVVFERSREIGTMAALGMTPRRIVSLFFAEAVIIGFFGALAGILAGSAISLIFNATGINFGAAFADMDFEMSQVIYPRLNLLTTLKVFAGAFSLSALATFLPSLRAARIAPMEALRTD